MAWLTVWHVSCLAEARLDWSGNKFHDTPRLALTDLVYMRHAAAADVFCRTTIVKIVRTKPRSRDVENRCGAELHFETFLESERNRYAYWDVVQSTYRRHGDLCAIGLHDSAPERRLWDLTRHAVADILNPRVYANLDVPLGLRQVRKTSVPME